MKAAYKIDPAHSRAHFTVRHMMITNVRGEFSGIQGTAEYDPENPGVSHVDVSIPADTISTSEPARDTHLKSADFLDVAQYPSMTFKSTAVASDGDELKITGDLTIHGVTRSIVLRAERPSAEVKDPWGNMRIGVTATTKIKRSEFGLTWNAALEAGGFMIGDEVKIELDMALVRA